MYFPLVQFSYVLVMFKISCGIANIFFVFLCKMWNKLEKGTRFSIKEHNKQYFNCCPLLFRPTCSSVCQSFDLMLHIFEQACGQHNWSHKSTNATYVHFICYKVQIILCSQGSKNIEKNLYSCNMHVTEEKYAHIVVHSWQ